MKPWTKEQIEGHKKAAGRLDRIMSDSISYISQNKDDMDEYRVQQFILDKFMQLDLISDSEPPIVAFGKNTQHVHYFPSKHNCSKLKDGDLIMIDIWARESKDGMPFADITFMGFAGNEPLPEQKKIFDLVRDARDSAILFIKKSLERGDLPVHEDIDREVRKTFSQQKVEKNFLHTTGHVLGFDQAHGDRNGVIGEGNKGKLLPNLGYTIEPGLYFEERFGVRSEVDFYLNDQMEFILTSRLQEKLIFL